MSSLPIVRAVDVSFQPLINPPPPPPRPPPPPPLQTFDVRHTSCPEDVIDIEATVRPPATQTGIQKRDRAPYSLCLAIGHDTPSLRRDVRRRHRQHILRRDALCRRSIQDVRLALQTDSDRLNARPISPTANLLGFPSRDYAPANGVATRGYPAGKSPKRPAAVKHCPVRMRAVRRAPTP